MGNNKETPENKGNITCHKVSSVFNIPEIKWRDDQPTRCSYCGSLHFDEVRRIIAEGGRLGGSDWKYGTPHKFYAYTKNNSDMYNFYTSHLIDLPREEFDDFAKLLKENTDIEFSYDDNGNLMYKAPYHGYQR
jgi:hypothetical protein